VCGRTASPLSRESLARLLDVDEVVAPELPPRWNVAPTQPVYALMRANGLRTLTSLRWGLVPNWAKDPRIGSKLINARAEAISQRPAYRSLLESRRVLLPFSGFYEWQSSDPSKSVRRQPFYFTRCDGAPLVFAGLWDEWADAEGKPIASCTIITTRANEMMAAFHHRMPVILAETSWEEWLGPRPLAGERLEQLLAPAAEDVLSGYPVSPAVNDVRNDRPELIEPVMPQRPLQASLWA